jgi:glycine/D-amino acid oxidase-like deaminating enzyme
VLDAYEPGFGASTRNAGHIGRYLHYPFSKLEAKFGREAALAMWNEAGGANSSFLAMLEAE